MSPQQVQAILADFANRATRVGTRLDGAEVWQFDVEGNHYELHYWVDDHTTIKKYLGGARAAREFAQLQAFQKLGIPATRVIANLKGFRIGDRKGDACIIVRDLSIRPLADLLTQPLSYHNRTAWTAKLIALLESLYRAKLCPVPLRIDLFAIKGDQIIVADGTGDFAGIITDDRLRELNRSTRLATRVTERLRFWKHFRQAPPPRASRSEGNALLREATRGEGNFAAIAIDDWTGIYLRKLPTVVPWLSLPALVEAADWSAALPSLIDSSRQGLIKDDRSGIVRNATVQLGGQSVEVLVKRPAFKTGLRGTIDRFRTSRAARTWQKNWRMLALGLPCEVPLLLLERRSGVRVNEQLVVFGRVPGPTMAKIDLDALSASDRSQLLIDCGRLLRRIDSFYFTHADAKNTNWIAWQEASGRYRPVLIDLDGIRYYPSPRHGLARFVRAMKTHPQIRDEDLEAIDTGYRRRRG